MRKVSLYLAASLDGQIARRNGSVDWLPVPRRREDYGYANFLRRIDTLVLGRKTYDHAVSGGEWSYGDRRSVVFSRTRRARSAAPVEFVQGDVAETVRALRDTSGGDIWLVGGGDVVRSCLRARVIDEIILSIPPVLMGEGISHFLPQAVRTQLHLRNCHAFPDGLVQLSYDVQN